jgi:hypothetical protein
MIHSFCPYSFCSLSRVGDYWAWPTSRSAALLKSYSRPPLQSCLAYVPDHFSDVTECEENLKKFLPAILQGHKPQSRTTTSLSILFNLCFITPMGRDASDKYHKNIHLNKNFFPPAGDPKVWGQGAMPGYSEVNRQLIILSS